MFNSQIAPTDSPNNFSSSWAAFQTRRLRGMNTNAISYAARITTYLAPLCSPLCIGHLSRRTLLPALIGLHDHLFRARQRAGQGATIYNTSTVCEGKSSSNKVLLTKNTCKLARPHLVLQIRGISRGPGLAPPPHSTSPYRVHTAQDIWARGVTFYTLLTGCMPFSDPFEPCIRMTILACRYTCTSASTMLTHVPHTTGVHEMSPDVRKGAENILRRHLKCSVWDRWTVDMVGEVAWGIGCDDSDSVAPRSQSHPASVLGLAIADDDGPHSPVMERGPSRLRSRRCLQLPSLHPYQRTTSTSPHSTTSHLSRRSWRCCCPFA